MAMMTRRDVMTAGSSAMLLGACMQDTPLRSGTRSSDQPARRVLWAANVRTKSLADRLTAARAGGFTHMSVFPIDWKMWRQTGLSVKTLRSMMRDAGIKVLAVDPFVQWIPGFAIPPGYPPQNRSFIEFDEAAILQIAEEAEAEGINCVEGLGMPYPEPVLIEAFGAFADRAATRGLRVTLEFMPISSITGLREGWQIVGAVNRDNAGLCFDTWHYFRSYEDAATLARIPPEKIFEVQLADARWALRGADLIDDLLRFRLLPGDGEMPIARIAADLKRQGAWRSVGPEVFADWIDPLPALEVGQRCSRSMQQLLARLDRDG